MTANDQSQGAAPQEIPPAVTGVAHVIAAARYSLGGLQRLMGETAARLELVAGAGTGFLLLVLGASALQLAAFAILFALLLAVEALNTAIEVLTDRISPEWSVQAKHAKDLGSLAVALLIFSNTLCVGGILLSLFG
ncbi:MAG: diacylglycerol kinase [Phaeobacter gallaeciensis]